MRTLTQRELNRALLARQLLLERAPTPLPKALERLAGIQAQYAPSMYVGLFARLDEFGREQLTNALERRTVVQATLMRHTIHLVSKADYWPLAQATRIDRRAGYRRSVKDAPDDAAMEAAAAKLHAALDGGTMTRKEIDALLGKPAATAVGMWLDLVRVPPSGTWERRRADLYAAAADWIGEPPRPDDPEAHLVRRYLGGFGPASFKDVVSFTGLLPDTVRAALERLTTRRFQAESGEELIDVPRAPLPDADTPAPPRFLPTWDATLLVHARRTQILPEEHRPKIFHTKNPHSSPTFLVDGQVAGTWRHEAGKIRLEPFGRLAPADRRELEDEAERLREFHA